MFKGQTDNWINLRRFITKYINYTDIRFYIDKSVKKLFVRYLLLIFR